MKKGSSVILEGRVENDNYEDKNGVKHYSVNIMVERIEFAGNKRSSGEGGGSYNSGGESNTNSNYDDNSEDVDVPF